MKVLIATIFLCALGTAAAQVPPGKAVPAQKPAATAKKASPVAGRSECALAIGLCVTVPGAWQRLGDVFDDLGFVVAEPHAGIDSANWPQLTVAAIDVAPRKGSSAHSSAPPLDATSPDAPSLDALVDIVLTPDGSFTSAETLQRSRLILNGRNAEIVRVRLHDTKLNDTKQSDTKQSDAVEEVALIEGDDGLVYSIAMRSAPEDSARLESIFRKVIRSWRMKQVAVPLAKQAAPQTAPQSATQPPPQPKPEQDSKTK